MQDSLKRPGLKQSTFALALVVPFVLLAWWTAQLAGTPRAWITLWAVTAILGEALVVLALWRGWARRLKDPTLTLQQLFFTMFMTACCYPFMGHLRTAVLPVYLLVLCFAMFQLRTREAFLALALVTLAMIGLAMGARWLFFPTPGSAEIDGVHFAVMLLAVLGVAVLAARMAGMRERLRAQREELKLALARIEELAIRDALTGLYNRRHGETLVQAELARAAREQSAFHVLLIDLDHFKRVNDTHGHAAGDAVLRGFARLALDALRVTDTLVRWGGEEFLLLMPGLASHQAIERLQLSTAAALLRIDEDLSLSVQFSGGLAQSRPDDSLQSLVARADGALYRAKAQGRNQVVAG